MLRGSMEKGYSVSGFPVTGLYPSETPFATPVVLEETMS